MRRLSSVAVVPFALLALLSCSSSSGNSYSGMSTGPIGGTGTPSRASVSIVDYAFSPSAVTITHGGTVTWSNDGTVAHTVTADSGGFTSGQLASPTGGGAYGGGTAGAVYSTTFTLPGTYTYHCSNHPTMTGRITVQ